MSKADLTNVLANAGGGVRRKQSAPAPLQDTDPAKQSPTGRVGTAPITVHYPREVRAQLKIMAIEEDRTMQSLIAEGFNDLFAKYGKAEIAPAD